MNPKQKLKIGVDLLMTASLLLLMAYELVGQAAHEWIGTGMFLLFLLHNLLNRRWYGSLLKGKYTPYRILQTALVALVLAAMLIQAASGIVLSRHLFTFLPIRGGARLARTLHMLGGYWGFLLMSLHLGLHWNSMMGAVRRMAGAPSPRRTMLLRSLAGAIACYGLYAFFRREIGSYLFLQIQFAFFDFEEPLLSFFADYLAVMGLFVAVGHYLAAALKRIGKAKAAEIRKDELT